MIRTLATVAALFMSEMPVFAQDNGQVDMVTATDAQGVLRILQSAGYDVKFVERGEDNSTYIEVETGTGLSSVIFSDCDAAVPDFCETLVLSTWWDRDTPMSDKAIADANRNNKYVTVFRRESGDPMMQWAILTRREGVPATVFLNSLHRFSGIARDFREAAYADDGTSESDQTADIDGSAS